MLIQFQLYFKKGLSFICLFHLSLFSGSFSSVFLIMMKHQHTKSLGELKPRFIALRTKLLSI